MQIAPQLPQYNTPPQQPAQPHVQQPIQGMIENRLNQVHHNRNHQNDLYNVPPYIRQQPIHNMYAAPSFHTRDDIDNVSALTDPTNGSSEYGNAQIYLHGAFGHISAESSHHNALLEHFSTEGDNDEPIDQTDFMTIDSKRDIVHKHDAESTQPLELLSSVSSIKADEPQLKAGAEN